MREIKFRAWDKEQKIMAYSDDFLNIDLVKRLKSFFHWIQDLNPILMQYTGLKDKNGKEIYEGDIVTHPLCVKEPHDVDEPCETFWGRIVFEVDRGQYFAINTKRNGYVIVMEEAYKFEVIGTIYENPELLEAK